MAVSSKKTWGEHPLSLWLLGIVVVLFGVVHTTTTTAYDNEIAAREKSAKAALVAAKEKFSLQQKELEKDIVSLRRDLDDAKVNIQQIELKLEAIKQVKEALAKIERTLDGVVSIAPKVDRILDLLPRT